MNSVHLGKKSSFARYSLPCGAVKGAHLLPWHTAAQREPVLKLPGWQQALQPHI